MVKAIAIDDEQMALDVLINYAGKLSRLDLVKTFINPFEAMDYLNTHFVQLVFLDINMPDLSGLGMAKNLSSETNIVFTTAYPQHAVQSYELDAVDFLVKPFSIERFMKSVDKVERRTRRNLQSVPRDFLFLKSGYEQHKLNLKDLHYVESDGNYMVFHTTKGKVMSRMTMKEALMILSPESFIQIHKSYIVSVRQVQYISNNKVSLNGIELPVSQSYRERFYNLLESKGK